MNKCVFLDRDGVINKEIGDYIMTDEEYVIDEGVPEALRKLKEAGYLLVVITNQGGIAKGLYGHDLVRRNHDYTQEVCGGVIDAFYYSPYHQKFSNSLSKKPGSLMFEKAMAKFNIDPSQSWMVGDRIRDLHGAAKVGVKGVFIGKTETPKEPIQYRAENLLDAVEKFIVGSK